MRYVRTFVERLGTCSETSMSSDHMLPFTAGDLLVATMFNRRLNAMVEADYSVTFDQISQEELQKRPQLIKTMSVKPPQNTKFVRLVRIGDDDKVIDLQPCGGTHVHSTAEIGKLFISKIEKKGRMNRRVSVVLQD